MFVLKTTNFRCQKDVKVFPSKTISVVAMFSVWVSEAKTNNSNSQPTNRTL